MRLAAAILLLAVMPVSAVARQSTPTPAQPATAQKVVAAPEQSGLNYRKAADAIWAVTFKGGGNNSFDVMINAQNRLVIVLAVVARKPSLSPAQLASLLRVNDDAKVQ